MMHQSPEDAFAMDPQDQIVLRVLAGVQQGAEMSLQPRSYIVGSGEDADIVLAERGLEPRHLALELDGAAPGLVALDARVQLGDAWIDAGTRADITLPAVLRIGATVVLLADGKQLSTDVAIPEPLPEPGTEPLEQSATDTDSTEGELEAGAPDTAVAEGPSTISADPEQPEQPPGRTRRPTVMVAGSALVLLALSGAAVAIFPSDGGTGTGDAAQTAAAQDRLAPIRGIVADLGFADLEVTEDPSLGPTLHGYLDTRADQAALRTALADAGIEAADRTRTGDQILDAVGVTLGAVRWPEEGFGQHLETRYLGGGAVEIDGFLGPSIDRNALRRRIFGDVPALSSLRFARADLRDWREDLEQRIKASGLADWLTVAARDGLLRVDGELSEGQVPTWRSVGEAFVQESGGFPRISSHVVATVRPDPGLRTPPVEEQPEIAAPQTPEAEVTRPEIRLVGTVIGGADNRWAVLADGRHVRLGDRLRSGAIVSQIEADRLQIGLGEQTFTYWIREN